MNIGRMFFIEKRLCLRTITVSIFLLCVLSYPRPETKADESSDIVLVASTPGDSLIKSQLTIPQETNIDFIRWDLTLRNSKTFLLTIHFGIGKPNTRDFIGGGQTLKLEGTYAVSHHHNSEVYQLQTAKQTSISFIKLNDNLFHLLTPGNHFMVGNGGWSYTLNRKELFANISQELPFSAVSSSNDTVRQSVFVGRTPCGEIAEDYKMDLGADCHKLKWKLILNKDPRTLAPTTYILKRTAHRQSDITGKWAIIKGTKPNTIIYQLDPDKPEESISLFVGDDNVLFLLDKRQQYYIGNNDFSYTFNRGN